MRIDPDVLKQCWFLAGPTAAGKSASAVELAEKINAEIVSMDSMALFRGMDIGTAKPSDDLLSRVPHHLVNVADPADDFSVADYVSRAASACSEIVSRGQIPLFVGGTGLYLRSLLRGLFNGPEADWELRNRWEQAAVGRDPGWLHAELQLRDPESASRLHPNDMRRIIRAIEVYELTGTPLSDLQNEHATPPDARPQHVYVLDPPTDWLAERINVRVQEMFDAGLVLEVQRLRSLTGGISRTASQALGYAEVQSFLDGNGTLETAIRLTQDHTRQFAKRQRTWFRNLPECTPIETRGLNTATAIAAAVFERAGSIED